MQRLCIEVDGAMLCGMLRHQASEFLKQRLQSCGLRLRFRLLLLLVELQGIGYDGMQQMINRFMAIGLAVCHVLHEVGQAQEMLKFCG